MAIGLIGWLGDDTSPARDRARAFVRWRYLVPLLGLAAGALAGFAVASVMRRNRRPRAQLELAPRGVALEFDKGGVALSAAQEPGPGPEAATAADAGDAAAEAATGADTAQAAAATGADTAEAALGTVTDTEGTDALPSGPPGVGPQGTEAAPAEATAKPQRVRRPRKIQS